MKPVCVPCRMFFRPKQNGAHFEEGMKVGPDAWGPYKLWQGDLWACPTCDAEIIVGVGSKPIAEHYEDSYVQQVAYDKPLLRVDDC